MKTDKRLFLKINRVQKVLFKYVEKEVREQLGVTPVQLGVLFYLQANNGCHLKDISRELEQNNSAITTLIERMEKNGLLLKKVSETDGRAFQVYSTDKGLEIAEKGLPVIHEFNSKLTEDIPEKELDSVHNFLDKALTRFVIK
jgi:DNA-binding MarR family transcriptional regulator